MTTPRFRAVRYARLLRFPKLYLACKCPQVPAYVRDAMALLICEVRAERSLR